MKKALVLTTVLLIFTLAPYTLSNMKKSSTIVFALGGIESCDSAGNTVNEFNPSDQVYVKGSGLEAGGLYCIYIVEDYSSWTVSETHISDLYIVEGPIIVDVNASGYVENQPVLIWESASPGYYDIWADSQTDGETDVYDECDAIDNLDVNNAGFFVISEMLIIAIPVLFAYLLFSVPLKRRKSFRKQKNTSKSKVNSDHTKCITKQPRHFKITFKSHFSAIFQKKTK
ncbi:hypothetical protein KEJ15_05115 [Candidatus Bathyarchaeota archaeon]|nr:hypothetical protein [Candidatus Bathyarchaeota archaeon]